MDNALLVDMIAPIPGGMPAGADVRVSGQASELYLTIKDERASARTAEREALASGDPDIDPLTAGLRAWAQVATQGGDLLTHHAKDLQVAAWLVEAWLRTDGLPGLADGFTLLAELVERYWDEGLHPIEDEEGVETRLAPLFGLFGREEPGTLIQPIKLLPLTDVRDTHVALWTIEAVRAQTARHDDPEVREELVAKRAQRIAELDAAVAGASPSFIRDNLEAIDRALAEMDRLMSALNARSPYGRFGSQVAAPLAAVADILREHYVAPAAATAPDDEEEASGDAPVGAGGPAAAAPPKQKVMDRQASLATLLEIAEFFDRTEPQSLIGLGLRDLVRRAKLPVEDLVAELIPNREQREMFLLRAGIRAGGGSDDFSSF